MYVRISLITGASNFDRGLAFLDDQVVPELRQQRGFQGLTASGDRSAGWVNVLAMWETAADLDASESTAEKARADAVKLFGGQASVERFEQLAWEVGPVRPGPGAKLHIRRIRMDPSRIDDNLDYFRRDVVPQMKSTPGFLSVRLMMDRSTGEGAVGNLWADHESLTGSLARAEQRRAAAESRGIAFGEQRFGEMLFTTPMRP